MSDEHPSTTTSTPGEDLPDRMRVHSLARVLGTTSRRVLDALAEFDGRRRSAHSSVLREDAVRVRDVLGAAETDGPTPAPALAATPDPAPGLPDVPGVPDVPEVVAVTTAEESDAASPVLAPAFRAPAFRAPTADTTTSAPSTTDEATDEAAAEASRAVAMPLFVAPQPVTAPAAVGRPAVDGTASKGADVAATEDDGTDSAELEGEAAGTEGDDGDTGSEGGSSRSRRRRRGRRGRGRGRGEQGDTDGDADESAETDEAVDGNDEPGAGAADGHASDDGASDGGASDGGASDDGASDDDASEDDASEDGEDGGDASADGGSRRRRRRRRRKSGGSDDGDDTGDGSDDPPNTVVHERAPREKKKSDADGIQGISGSTRLEAKRQRRRDGRDAGRRRPPILTEAEFLARRESVERIMVVRDKVRTEPPHEGARYTQIAVLEDGLVVEHFVTSEASASLVGNIYLGIVQNVLPSMEAAFIDIGRGRNGVLYAGEVNWEAAGLGGSQRKIEQALRPGQPVVVQVSKDPVGHKGARLTTQVSLAGRYLVYVPGASSTGISRKLPDTERQRLKQILKEVVPDDAGVIIRTASEGVKEEDIRADVTRLQERWTEIEESAARATSDASGVAVALYEEPDVLVKVIRDLFNEDFTRLTVSGEAADATITSYIESVAPELLPKLTRYAPEGDNPPDVFAVHRVDEQLAKAMDRKVWLPSGGSLVIDRTEAMTVVDVNTGKFTGSGGNLEQTVTKNNLEAAEETVRQLRLRDIGGMVVIDFIDMVLESNRDLVLRRLTEALGRDRTRHQVSEVTSLGLVQLTRKRLSTGLVEAFSTTCSHCAGRGIMVHADPVDTASGRKGDAGGSGGGTGPQNGNGNGNGGSRRGRRGKKGRTDEAPPTVAKVPAHAAGAHPMFKAMAAAHDKDGNEVGPDASSLDEAAAAVPIDGDAVHEVVGEESAAQPAGMTPAEVPDVEDPDEDELGDDEDSDDFDSEDDDSDDEDDDLDTDELDDSDDEDDPDDDLDTDEDELDDGDDEDGDSDDEDDDSDDEDDDSDDEDDEAEDDDEPVVEVAVVTPEPPARRRRRAAARPAGPPVGG